MRTRRLHNLLKSIEKEITFSYTESSVIPDEVMSQIDITKLYFNSRPINNMTKATSLIIWYLTLTNLHPFYKFEQDNPDKFTNLTDEKVDYVNSKLVQLFSTEYTKEELIHLCSSTNTINVDNFEVLITYLISSLYVFATTQHSKLPIDIDEIDNEIDYFIHHRYSLPLLIHYFNQLMKYLKIGDFDCNIKTSIPKQDSNDVHNLIKLSIPMYYTTDLKDKKYITLVEFVSNVSYNFIINVETNDDPSLVQKSLKYDNVILHLMTRTEYIKHPDECKLISIYPFQNKVIKFKHDPMISNIVIYNSN